MKHQGGCQQKGEESNKADVKKMGGAKKEANRNGGFMLRLRLVANVIVLEAVVVKLNGQAVLRTMNE